MIYNKQKYTTWDCKYHVVFISKYRRKVLFGQGRKLFGNVFYDLAISKESRIEEGHIMKYHVHMLLSILPKYSMAQVVEFTKGKSAIWMAQNFDKKVRNFTGSIFWARGYFVSTVGREEELIRKYIRHQEDVDKQYKIQQRFF